MPQANGQIAPEPVMDVSHVAQAVLHMAALPLSVNVPFMTVMARDMPYIGRGSVSYTHLDVYKRQVMISSLWTRFVPHFTTGQDVSERIIGIPDPGVQLPLGQCRVSSLPAHFMHAEGNFQFYDPVSKILFTGDLGASIVSSAKASEPVTDFASHIQYMDGFHKRYIVSGKICKYLSLIHI